MTEDLNRPILEDLSSEEAKQGNQQSGDIPDEPRTNSASEALVPRTLTNGSNSKDEDFLDKMDQEARQSWKDNH